MELQYQVNGNMDPSKSNVDLPKFKRRRISAVRDYPIHFGVNLRKEEEVAHVHPYACCPVLKKYPPPKLRGGFTVRRDFPVKLNVPIASRNQISVSKGSDSDNGIPMEDCKRLDVLNAANFSACTDGNQSNSSVSMPSESFNVPTATNAHDLLACINYKEDGVEESSLLMDIEDKQCEVDVPIANNIYACTNVRDGKPANVHNVSNACDIHVCIKPTKEGVEESSLLTNIGDEQCRAAVFSLGNYQVAHEDCQSNTSLTKGVSSSMVVADERCSDSMFGVHDSEETFNVEDCVEVHDSQAAFNDDEECVKAAEVNDSQVGPSNDKQVTNNELKNDRDKVKGIINLFREVCNELLRDNKGKSKAGFTSEAVSILLKRHKWIKRDKHLGPIPGIEVGDHFDWRVELNIIGLHCRNIHGIDYMKFDEKNLAISVVDSRRYDNIFESKGGEFPDSLIYLGEGENPNLKGKKPIEDQKLRAGNLALKNSAEAKTPIRVIRKFFYKRGKIEKHKYVYDGLYFADSYRQETASSGKLVFKFLLKKFPTQPKLDWTKVRELYE